MRDVKRNICIKIVFLCLATASAWAEKRSGNYNSVDSFSFALIGDLPYGVGIGEEDRDTDQLIEQINDDRSLAWVLHVGDIKTGGSSCSDEMFADRKKRFENIKVPFVFTPGDNEWTDCHRLSAGSFDPLDRLQSLRNIFFYDPWAERSRKNLNISSQSQISNKYAEFIENYSWKKNGVFFATIHIVGSNNGKKDFALLSKQKRNSNHDNEVKKREEASLHWLNYNFQKAVEHDAKAMFITIHANPGLDWRWQKETKPEFDFFNKALAEHLKKFKKPVVLAHGDSHYARIDSPPLVGKRPHKQFLRVESFGENNNAWIKVVVNPSSPSVFSFEFFDRVNSEKTVEPGEQ